MEWRFVWLKNKISNGAITPHPNIKILIAKTNVQAQLLT